MRMRLLQALIQSVANRASVLAVAAGAAAAVGPLYSRYTHTGLSPGDAAAWGFMWGFIYGIILIMILPAGSLA